jgi:hypothetical protein
VKWLAFGWIGGERTDMSGSWHPSEFPNLTETDHIRTSEKTVEYNCIAWSACENEVWWWPDPQGIAYWPDGAPREQTIEAFVSVYTNVLGYEVCDSPDLEDGFEKIALYANANGDPTHAARQLENGKWTSKLGGNEDIEHVSLECLNGELYGSAVKFFKRNINR